MIIENLEMKNFKSHKDTRIDFDTGITIIMGGNGAGKSSILEAISFALFKQHSSKKIEQLITLGDIKNKLYIKLDFTSNGRTYRVTRERGKTGSKASILIKDHGRFQQLASGDSQVTKEIQSILEMDGDLFLNAVYVRQGEIADLVDKTPSEKKQLIGKLLGIDSLEKAWKSMKNIIDEYSKEKIRLEGKLENTDSLNSDIESVTNERDKYAAEIENITSNIDAMESKINSMNRDNEKFQNDQLKFQDASTNKNVKEELLKELRGNETDIQAQLNEITDKESQMEEIEPQLPKLEKLICLKEALENLRILKRESTELKGKLEKISKLEEKIELNKQFYDEYSKVSEEINQIETDRSEFEGSRKLLEGNNRQKEETLKKMGVSHNKIVTLIGKANLVLGTKFTLIEELKSHIQTIKPENKAEIDELTEKINQLNKDISNLKTQNKDLKNPINELEYVKEKCPICESEIDETKRNELINRYQSQIDTNTNKISNFSRALTMFTETKTNLEAKYSAIQDINIDVMNEQLESLKNGQNELKNLKDSNKELNTKVESLNKLDDELKAKKEIQRNLKPKYEEYLSAQGSLKSLEDPEEIRNQLHEVEDNKSQMTDKVHNLIEMIGGSVENLSEEIAYFQGLKSKYDSLSGAVATKESLLNRIKNVQSRIITTQGELDQLIKEIESIAYDKEKHSQLKDTIKLTQGEYLDLTGKKQHLIGLKAGAENRLNGLQKQLGSYEKYRNEMGTLNDFIKLLEYIRDIYGKDGVQKDLRDFSRPLIEQNTRDFFEKFNFEYSDIRLDNEYDVTVYGPAGESNLDMISGGEKIAVALALRLGITKTLSGGALELIMLDEPTIHLDAYRRQELIDLLKKMSIIPQMIIVTHDIDLEDAADNILKVEKDEGISQVHI
ncbi:MAG: AAA family ATPase [Methanobacterium sp.]|nr:AAA family ATPase [Methanobacterium sp.]